MTRFEQIAAAFPLHAQRIAECVYEQHEGTSRLHSLMNDEPQRLTAGRSLLDLFSFEATTEGHKYWWTLATAERG